LASIGEFFLLPDAEISSYNAVITIISQVRASFGPPAGFPETRCYMGADLALPGYIAGYLRDRNSVAEIQFEITKPIVKVKMVRVISEATRQKLSAASKRRWMKTKVCASRQVINKTYRSGILTVR